MKKLFSLGPQFHGHGSVIFAWQPSGNFVASIGEGQRNLYLFDRRGVQVEEVALKSTSKVLQLEWDKDGEILAILQQNEGGVWLWHQAARKLEVLEMNSKDPTFLTWSKVGPQLAIGTSKGNMMIYNKRTMKKQTIMGKHSKQITCGAWNVENILALGSQDRTISLSGEDGDSLDQISLKNDPGMIQFADMKTENPNEHGRAENTVSLVLGNLTLLLLHMKDPQKPMELAFQAKYGTIKSYCWFGDGYLILGFSLGYIVIISSQMKEISEELSSVKYHSNSLDCVCCSKAAGKIASAGDDGIRIISMKDWKEVKSERIAIRPESKVTHMHWSKDGELLSFATESGWIYCYLAKLTALSATCGTRLAYLTSLREMTIIEGANEHSSKVVLTTDVEPAFMALGPNHLATGMNNRIWFYSCTHQANCHLVNEQEYVGTVESVSLNATHAVVLIEGRVYLHPIERDTDGRTLIFPRKEDDRTISCASIVGNFLIYAHANGRLQYYSLVDGTEVNEYKTSMGIRKIYPNHEGTRVVVIDTMGGAWLYNPVNDDCLPIEDFPSSIDRILWDTVDPCVFVASDNQSFHTFIYTQVECGGSGVRRLGNIELGPEGELRTEPAPTQLIHGNIGVLLVDGTVICQAANGSLTQQRLRTHELLSSSGRPLSEDTQRQLLCFKQALALNRFQYAFKVALGLNQKEIWLAMGRRSLECLDVGWAKKAYRQAPSPGMVQYLERIQIIEDKQLLSGHVAGIFGDFKKAREYFLQSCNPEAALDMHCDFLQWDQALQLAQSLAPKRLPEIFLKSALQLEARGEYQAGQTQFEQASKGRRNDPEHQGLCAAGVARTCLRLGDLNRGVKVAMERQDPAVSKECAQILEGMKQFVEAAQLYEKAGAYDRAASLYIQDLNFEAAGPLMGKITTPKLHMQYAKAKESRGAFKEALVAYERARDLDSVVRLYLQHLGEPQKAFQLVRTTQLASGAELVADYCRKQGNVRGAVEFLLLANNDEEAFHLAETHDEMEVYEQGLDEKGTQPQHLGIAKYYEQRNLLPKAAKHYSLGEEYNMALKLYLKVGEKEIDNAIDVVGKARSDALTHTLIDYLMGESDNVPKDPNYVYRLHKALGNYMQAAGTALIIARQEQEMGNYKLAHSLLFRTYQDLKQQKLALPQELWRRLMVLHSYVLVKRLVKVGNHHNAALMLLRVAKNIQQFPAHIVPILTSVVIECQKANLKTSAYQFACTLMRPEYRPQVLEQYKRKIETIVRKPINTEEQKEKDTPEANSPCPYCGTSLAESQLDCSNCKNISPFCIASGMHMLSNDWSYCPSCQFPARYSALFEAAKAGDTCPMCDQALKPSEIPNVSDAQPYLNDYKALFQQSEMRK